MLTTKDMVALTGVSHMFLHRWATSGVVVPTVNGWRGRGRQRLYSTAQAVALCYACQLVDYGWQPQGVGKSIRQIARLSDEELSRRIDRGETLLIPPGVWANPKKLGLNREDRKLVGQVDLSKSYQRVMEHLQQKIVCNSRH